MLARVTETVIGKLPVGTILKPPNPAFADVQDFLRSEAAPQTPYPICIKNSSIDAPHILFNTEQLTRRDLLNNVRKNFHLGVFRNEHIVEIWDYSTRNIDILNHYGVQNCRHVPFTLWPAYAARLLSYNPARQYPHDVAFCGWLSPRRKKVVDELQGHGVRVDVIDGTYGEARDIRIAKCRILLNVHFDDDYMIFEKLRCFPWIATGKTVVSEHSLDNDPDCLNVRYDDLADTVLALL